MATVHQAEVLIIGGGIAGLSTARHLARGGQGGVVLLDREELPGFYASGHNAGIARQLTGVAEHTALTVEGCARLHAAGMVDGRGGILLGLEQGGTEALAAEAAAFGLPFARLAGSPYPELLAEEQLRVPSDGEIDTDGLLRFCAEGAREAGARLAFGVEVRGVHPGPEGFEVETSGGTWRTRILVNAAGAWARELGRWAGGLDLAFRPLRRHLVWSSAPSPSDRPYTWWADQPLYVRPESGGLLLCACEEEEVPLPGPHRQPEVCEAVLERLADLLGRCAPALAERPIARLWCGLRTFAPDRRFLIGRDPLNPRLFWVAGLGGHGMTSGLAVGALAARVLLEGTSAGPLDPARFLPS